MSPTIESDQTIVKIIDQQGGVIDGEGKYQFLFDTGANQTGAMINVTITFKVIYNDIEYIGSVVISTYGHPK